MRSIVVVILLSFGQILSAQSLNLEFNSTIGVGLKPIKELSRPQKASIWSAVLPGAGQIYNKRYVKAGVVWAGFAGITYMYLSQTDSMNSYQNAYKARVDDDPLTLDTKYPYLSDASVKSYRDFHRRMREISILGFAGFYALQIIDANVDAHLFEFRVNEDLSLRVSPEYRYNTDFGLNLTFTF